MCILVHLKAPWVPSDCKHPPTMISLPALYAILQAFHSVLFAKVKQTQLFSKVYKTIWFDHDTLFSVWTKCMLKKTTERATAQPDWFCWYLGQQHAVQVESQGATTFNSIKISTRTFILMSYGVGPQELITISTVVMHMLEKEKKNWFQCFATATKQTLKMLHVFSRETAVISKYIGIPYRCNNGCRNAKDSGGGSW